MYKVRAGIYLNDIRHAEFSNVCEAMDFADMLYDKGFDYAEVVDGDRDVLYSVENFTPMTASQRRARELRAQDFSMEWNQRKRMEKLVNPKELQDEAYATYAFNIQYSNDLDIIMGYFHGDHGSMPSVNKVLEVMGE